MFPSPLISVPWAQKGPYLCPNAAFWAVAGSSGRDSTDEPWNDGVRFCRAFAARMHRRLFLCKREGKHGPCDIFHRFHLSSNLRIRYLHFRPVPGWCKQAPRSQEASSAVDSCKAVSSGPAHTAGCCFDSLPLDKTYVFSIYHQEMQRKHAEPSLLFVATFHGVFCKTLILRSSRKGVWKVPHFFVPPSTWRLATC